MTDVGREYQTLWWGRAQPWTKGHELGVLKAKSLAEKNGGKYNIIVSHAVSSKKNPLTVKQKLKYGRLTFGDQVKISESSHDSPSILHHASKIYADGCRIFVVVSGEDRRDEYYELLKKYNGNAYPHGFYDFKFIDSILIPGRDIISGTMMREAADRNDFDTFRQGAPEAMIESKVAEMYRDVRRRLKSIKAKE
jgi:hypothetical protein